MESDATPYATISPTLSNVRKSLTLAPVVLPFELISNSAPVWNTNFSLVRAMFAANVDTPTDLPTDFASVMSWSLIVVIFLPTFNPLTSIGSLIWNSPCTSLNLIVVPFASASTRCPLAPLNCPLTCEEALAVRPRPTVRFVNV